MKTAIIIHGMPSKEEYLSRPDYTASEQQWLPWIKAELEKNGIKTETPEMPEPYDPDYATWHSVFDNLQKSEDTIFVGHSAGGGFLVRWLSEHNLKVGKVVLVAPWIDPNHKFALKMFSDFDIDKNLAQRTDGVIEFISLDDDQEELQTLEILKQKIRGLQVRQFTDKGHFIFDHMKTNEFPELLEELLK